MEPRPSKVRHIQFINYSVLSVYFRTNHNAESFSSINCSGYDGVWKFHYFRSSIASSGGPGVDKPIEIEEDDEVCSGKSLKTLALPVGAIIVLISRP